ncbi:hypothetical protein AALP_AA8G296700 [Arabis alpina]|uniref:Uncharacterized protein n=1 Tax=Arabis alpina TaxID=50452 RepID=A0A087GAB1_ARAAL|nr:hypothetical protein AALP_AA8G296700 [Arabis alpina]
MENQSVDEAFGFEIDGRERVDDTVTGATMTSVSSPGEPTSHGDVASVSDGPRSRDVGVISTGPDDGIGSIGCDGPRPSDVVADDPEVPDVPLVPSSSRLRAEGQRSSVMSSAPIPNECLETSGVDTPMRITRPRDPDDPLAYPEVRDTTEGLVRPSVGGSLPLNGRADVSPCSSSSDLQASSDESDDEDMFVEVEQTKKAKKGKKKVRVKVRPDPPGSSLSNEKSLRHLRKKCGISEEIVLVAPSLPDRADAPPSGYMSLEELKHTVTNVPGMALIAGFPSKDDHFEDRFFFVEISERTVEADCIDLVKTRWERRVKPSLPEVSEEFAIAMYTELSSGNGNWRKSFSWRRIERARSAEIFPGKILGRGLARMSFREQVALEVAAKTKSSSGSSVSRVVAPMTSSPTAPPVRARPSRPSASKTLLPPPSSGEVAEFCRLSAERARVSSGKRKGVDRETPSKRQRVDTFPAAVVGKETSASRVGGLLCDEAYSVVTSKASELSLFFDRLVSDYDKDVLSRDNELGAAKETNVVLQSRLDETVERNEALERDALSLQKVKKDYDDKLAKLKSRCTKAEGEVVLLKGELSSTSDLQHSRIEDAVAEVRDEMARGFSERTSKVAGLLAEIGGKGSHPPDLLTEVHTLRKQHHPIYDAHDGFADLLASVQRVLEIPVVSDGAAEASVAVDDDVEVSDEDDVKAIYDDEDVED